MASIRSKDKSYRNRSKFDTNASIIHPSTIGNEMYFWKCVLHINGFSSELSFDFQYDFSRWLIKECQFDASYPTCFSAIRSAPPYVVDYKKREIDFKTGGRLYVRGIGADNCEKLIDALNSHVHVNGIRLDINKRETFDSFSVDKISKSDFDVNELPTVCDYSASSPICLSSYWESKPVFLFAENSHYDSILTMSSKIAMAHFGINSVGFNCSVKRNMPIKRRGIFCDGELFLSSLCSIEVTGNDLQHKFIQHFGIGDYNHLGFGCLRKRK